ncbi:hypothetical protein FRC01_013887, partial [Tulasnella sp. 417]
MTYATCQAYCLGKSFKYAGLEYGSQCYCGNALNDPGKLASNQASCSMACAGDSTKLCGASWLMTLFQYNGAIGSSSSSSSSVASSTSTGSTTSSTSSVSSTLSSSSTLSGSSTVTSTTSSSSATASNLPAGWSSLGCYTDQSSPVRTLSGASTTSSTMTYTTCQDYCFGKSFKYAGLEYGGQCYCGNTLNDPGKLASNQASCSMACAGDSTKLCGASWLMNVFVYTPASSSSSSSISSTSSLSSTTGTSSVSSTTGTSSLSSTTGTSSSSTITGTSSSSTSASSTISASTCTTTTPTASGYAQLGCFRDSFNRVLPVAGGSADTTSQSISKCQATCFAMGYAYAGLETGSECWCGDSIHVYSDSGSSLDAASGCGMQCTGDSTKTCGGTWALMIYYNAAMDSGSCSYNPSATATTSGSASLTASSTLSSPSITGTPTATGNGW